MDSIQVIICRVGQAPTIEQIGPELADMQAIVGGYIEHVRMTDDVCYIDLWVNEEGLINGSEPNRLVTTDYGHEVPVHGDFFIAKFDGKQSTIGLTDLEVDVWMVKVAQWPMAKVPANRN